MAEIGLGCHCPTYGRLMNSLDRWFFESFLSHKALMYPSIYQNKEIVNKSKDGDAFGVLINKRLKNSMKHFCRL